MARKPSPELMQKLRPMQMTSLMRSSEKITLTFVRLNPGETVENTHTLMELRGVPYWRGSGSYFTIYRASPHRSSGVRAGSKKVEKALEELTILELQRLAFELSNTAISFTAAGKSRQV